MSEITTVGRDLAKNVFQVHGADASGRAVLRKKLRRDQVLAFFSQLQPCVVAMEACGGAHFAARTFGSGAARLGERFLRRLLIIGANSVIIKRHVHARDGQGRRLPVSGCCGISLSSVARTKDAEEGKEQFGANFVRRDLGAPVCNREPVSTWL